MAELCLSFRKAGSLFENLPWLVFIIDNCPYVPKFALCLDSVFEFHLLFLSLLMLSPSQLSHAVRCFLLASVFVCTVIKLSL